MRPALVSTWGSPKKHLSEFLSSAARHGLNPHNAEPTDWPGEDWRSIPWYKKTEAQARFVRDTQGQYDLYMFTDSYDVVFAAGWDEIITKYEVFGTPIVFAAECYPWPNVAVKDLYPSTTHRCRFLNAGFWMGTADAAMRLLNEMASVAAEREKCDQEIAVNAFLSNRHRIALDTSCSLCFCCNLDSLDHLELMPGRPKTKDTHQYPCMFHGNGNSPLHGIVEALAKPMNRYIPNDEEKARMLE